LHAIEKMRGEAWTANDTARAKLLEDIERATRTAAKE
jgi:hypothetical protein